MQKKVGAHIANSLKKIKEHHEDTQHKFRLGFREMAKRMQKGMEELQKKAGYSESEAIEGEVTLPTEVAAAPNKDLTVDADWFNNPRPPVSDQLYDPEKLDNS